MKQLLVDMKTFKQLLRKSLNLIQVSRRQPFIKFNFYVTTELLITSAVSTCCQLSCFDLFLLFKSKRTKGGQHGVTKRCRLSWLTNSALVALVYSLNGGGGVRHGKGLRGLSQWVQLCTWSPNKLWRSNSIFNVMVGSLKVHKIENFFDSDFGICIISLLVMSKN